MLGVALVLIVVGVLVLALTALQLLGWILVILGVVAAIYSFAGAGGSRRRL
jgi:hypothetical protein